MLQSNQPYQRVSDPIWNGAGVGVLTVGGIMGSAHLASYAFASDKTLPTGSKKKAASTIKNDIGNISTSERTFNNYVNIAKQQGHPDPLGYASEMTGFNPTGGPRSLSGPGPVTAKPTKMTQMKNAFKAHGKWAYPAGLLGGAVIGAGIDYLRD